MIQMQINLTFRRQHIGCPVNLFDHSDEYLSILFVHVTRIKEQRNRALQLQFANLLKMPEMPGIEGERAAGGSFGIAESEPSMGGLTVQANGIAACDNKMYGTSLPAV
jgi:hypothetical protein